MKRMAGFTLIELLITTLIFVFAIFGATQMFTGMLNQYKQESKIVETNIEGIVGLELLRRDIESAGYGLPWNGIGPLALSYLEVDASKGPEAAAAAVFNDAPTDAPRAVVSGNGTGWNATDYLVIKSTSVGNDDTCKKWTFLYDDDTTKDWDPDTEDLAPADRVVVLAPGINEMTVRTLVPQQDNAATFSTLFSTIASDAFADDSVTRVAYAVSPDTDPVMPFNRADYYVEIPATATDMPARCAAGTGILFKGVMSHGTRELEPFPLLDCVLDMQVFFKPDTDGNGALDTPVSDIALLPDTNGSGGTDAQEVRQQIKEIRVYILAQEGQFDRSFTQPTSSIYVGEAPDGRLFDLTTITDWDHYRWKLYTLVVKPGNLI